jgi:hypothetical protein
LIFITGTTYNTHRLQSSFLSLYFHFHLHHLLLWLLIFYFFLFFVFTLFLSAIVPECDYQLSVCLPL